MEDGQGNRSGLVFLTGSEDSGAAASTEALRERAATALERALHFTERSGDAAARHAAHVALRAISAEEGLEALAASQLADGSFPRAVFVSTVEALGLEPLAAQPSALVGTLDALVGMADLRGLQSESARRAETFLRAQQQADGSWGDPRTAPETRLFLTGMLAGVLGRTRFVRPEVLDGAGGFLGALWSPERVEGGSAAALAAFAHFFTNVHHELADEALQWCGRELERGFRTRRFEAVFVARVLLWCDAGALPGFGVAPRDVLERLLDEQASDGGFAELAAAGPAARVGPTLDALRAIVALCASF